MALYGIQSTKSYDPPILPSHLRNPAVAGWYTQNRKTLTNQPLIKGFGAKTKLTMEEEKKPLTAAELTHKKWEVKCHSWAIADTGDYDGYFELTNGDVSLRSTDDEQEALEFIAGVLNYTSVNLQIDHKYANEISGLEMENQWLRQVLKDNNIIF